MASGGKGKRMQTQPTNVSTLCQAGAALAPLSKLHMVHVRLILIGRESQKLLAGPIDDFELWIKTWG
jgi:hypothetical protein